MATTNPKASKAPKEPTQPGTHPTGWEHDWRNPDAAFDADDHCVDAELARSDPARR